MKKFKELIKRFKEYKIFKRDIEYEKVVNKEILNEEEYKIYLKQLKKHKLNFFN